MGLRGERFLTGIAVALLGGCAPHGFPVPEEATVERGVLGLPVPSGIPASRPAVAVVDLDHDGAPELLFGSDDGFPTLFSNHGDGTFSLATPDVPPPHPDRERFSVGLAVVDLTGDHLPDIVVSGLGFVSAYENLGGLKFGPPVRLYAETSFPMRIFPQPTFGDMDGDHDLDLALPAVELSALDGDGGPTTFPLLRNDDGHFTVIRHLDLHGERGLSLLGAFTDRDRDGDLDLLIASDRAGAGFPSTAMWRNDGVDAEGNAILVEDSAEVGVDLPWSGMGIATADLNTDGLPDYFIADIGGNDCIVSEGGGWVESAAALGLEPDLDDPSQWFGWSSHLEDLDNDGHLDALAVGGQADLLLFPDLELPPDAEHQPNQLWQGTPEGDFVPAEPGEFGSALHDYAAAVGDLEGDGVLEVVVTDATGVPRIYDMLGVTGSALTIRLHGPPENTLAIGTLVSWEAGDRSGLLEVQGPRSFGQSSPTLHVGLGDLAGVDRVTAHWPGGETTTVENVHATALLALTHPRAF